MTESPVEEVAHKLGIPWPEAEEGQLRQAADAFDAAARALDAEREACSAKVRTLVAHNSGGGMEEFASFWGRYEGSGAPGGGAMVASAQACRDTAAALRQFADEVERTKDSIRDQIAIAGATLVVGAAMAVMTFGLSAGAAAAAATAIANFAVAAGVTLSATAATIAGTVLVGAAFGAVEAVALNVLVVQPLSIALDEQEDFELGQLPQFAAYGAGGGTVALGVGAGLGRLPTIAGRTPATTPRVSTTLDDLTTFPGRPARSTTGDDAGGLLRDLTAAERRTLDDALRPSNLTHVFAPKHNFDPLVQQFGSREAVMEELVRNLGGPLPKAGRFEVARSIGSQTVIIRGAVVNGVPRIGTAFTP